MNRLFSHILITKYHLKKVFPPKSLSSIELVIKESEKRHSAQVCFVAEHALSPREVFQKKSSRDRALEVFSLKRIWDTENNSGVLVYLLQADKKVEIICDRGVSKKVNPSQWDKIIKGMEENFQKGWFEKGVILGISEITEVLETYFPKKQEKVDNELSDFPILL